MSTQEKFSLQDAPVKKQSTVLNRSQMIQRIERSRKEKERSLERVNNVSFEHVSRTYEHDYQFVNFPHGSTNVVGTALGVVIISDDLSAGFTIHEETIIARELSSLMIQPLAKILEFVAAVTV